MSDGWRTICINYATSILAASVAESVTFPLDLTKTRLQIQGEVALVRTLDASAIMQKRGMLTMASGIVREEGLHKLWQGLSPALGRHFIYTGVRMGVYEQMRDNVFGKQSSTSFAPWKTIVCGLAAGSIGQFVASPMDLVKVQMQMEGRRQMEGKPPRVRSVAHALQQTARAGGVRSLWAGWMPNVQRAALVNMGDLATYDTAKHALLDHTTLQDNWVCHLLASVCSGFVAATLSTPADVIKTRIMNQPRNSSGVGLYYKSSVHCFMETVRNEGFFSLYKGFIPIWSRMAPWSMTFWLTWEKIRSLTGSSSF